MAEMAKLLPLFPLLPVHFLFSFAARDFSSAFPFFLTLAHRLSTLLCLVLKKVYMQKSACQFGQYCQFLLVDMGIFN